MRKTILNEGHGFTGCGNSMLKIPVGRYGLFSPCPVEARRAVR
jgi:hypothetical protein